jgi:hypothetical protein
MVHVTKPHPVKYARSGSKLLYNFLDVVFSTLIFILVYIFWLQNLAFSFLSLAYIFLTGLLSGLLGSLIGRGIANYWNILKPTQAYLTSLINAMAYAFLIWLGFITLLFSNFDLNTPIGIMQLILVMVFIKLFVFYMADYYADKILFQQS